MSSSAILIQSTYRQQRNVYQSAVQDEMYYNTYLLFYCTNQVHTAQSEYCYLSTAGLALLNFYYSLYRGILRYNNSYYFIEKMEVDSITENIVGYILLKYCPIELHAFLNVFCDPSKLSTFVIPSHLHITHCMPTPVLRLAQNTA